MMMMLMMISLVLLSNHSPVDLLTSDGQVNSVKDNHYKEWRPESRQKRAAIWTDVDPGVLPTRRRRRTAQLVPAPRVRRSDQENQLNDGGTKFQVNVGYQPGYGT